MALLFAIASKDLTSEQRARVRNKIGEASSEALTTASFNISVARELFEPSPAAAGRRSQHG
jgi:hypothetical protein